MWFLLTNNTAKQALATIATVGISRFASLWDASDVLCVRFFNER